LNPRRGEKRAFIFKRTRQSPEKGDDFHFLGRNAAPPRRKKRGKQQEREKGRKLPSASVPGDLKKKGHAWCKRRGSISVMGVVPENRLGRN